MARQDGLDTPGRRSRLVPRVRLPNDAFGTFAESAARFMGTGTFIVWMTVFVVLWITANTVMFIQHWDPYPFILLNLFFSTQASYAAPLILLAQNRQEARDRVSLDHDREVAAQSRADMDFLAREIPEIRFRPPEATYLAWLDCTALDVPGSPAAHWLREGRVALSDGRVFGPGWERHARLNFATSRPILREALERMARALGRAPDRRREPLGPEPEARSA